MREILFRGKSKDGVRWVYGSLYKEGSQVFILVGGRFYPEPSNGQSALGIVDWYEVFPDSIGQFTGLHDSTTWKELTEQERKDWVMEGNMPSEWIGKKIYEDDIVEFINIDRQYVKGIVYYFGSCFLIQSIVADEDNYNLGGAFSLAKGLIKVIGNIHDNPKLQLEEQEQ